MSIISYDRIPNQNKSWLANKIPFWATIDNYFWKSFWATFVFGYEKMIVMLFIITMNTTLLYKINFQIFEACAWLQQCEFHVINRFHWWLTYLINYHILKFLSNISRRTCTKKAITSPCYLLYLTYQLYYCCLRDQSIDLTSLIIKSILCDGRLLRGFSIYGVIGSAYCNKFPLLFIMIMNLKVFVVWNFFTTWKCDWPSSYSVIADQYWITIESFK